MIHWFYNIISFGGRALPAPVAELGRRLQPQMKILTSLFLAALLVGCATTPRDTSIRAAAVQTFGSDTNLKIHEVMYTGPLSSALSSMGTSDELALASTMQRGATQNLDLVVWSESSSKVASTLLRALRYPGSQKLPHLRLLFVGKAQDGERVRSAVEATGAKFHFHQR
ncbi:MAG: hypothetical protein HZA89_04975 [Verrucomicrobia bacterium]|nr:hypothetical protein [Verrucomicrobiota bacterium]